MSDLPHVEHESAERAQMSAADASCRQLEHPFCYRKQA